MMGDQHTYTREALEALLHSVWSEELQRLTDTEIDPELRQRRATPDPRRAIDLWAMRADVQRAWASAPLTHRQRQALVLRYGLDLILQEVGEELGITGSAASELCSRGLVVLAMYLNGADMGEKVLREAEQVVISAERRWQMQTI